MDHNLDFDILSGSTDLEFGRDTRADLRLNTPQDGSADLHFGAAPPHGSSTWLELNATMQPFGVEGLILYTQLLSADITMPQLGIDAEVVYLVDVWRGPQASPGIPFDEGQDAPLFTLSPFRPQTERPRNEQQSPWQKASGRTAETAATFADPASQKQTNRLPWDVANSARNEITAPAQDLARHNQTSRQPWDVANATHDEQSSAYRHPPRQQHTVLLPADNAGLLHHYSALPYIYPRKRRKEYRLPWDIAAIVVSLWPRSDAWIPPPILPIPITPDINLICLRIDGDSDIPFGRICLHDNPYKTIPRLRTYIVIHDIDIIRVSDNTPIHANRVSLSLDADSWAWGFSANLLGKDSLDAVLPINGEPVELSITINGYEWRVLVEDWSENREFGRRGISVKGRGLSALLASPYQLPGSGVNASLMTIQQLLESYFPIGEGWALNWDAITTPWNIPAGAWTWQNQTAINAIHAAVQGVGLVAVPSRNSKSFDIVERYPLLPWNYANATPNLTVPDSAIIQLTRQQAIATQANAVYVHGDEVGGVMARVYRTGSAGDRIAPTHNSPLITDLAAARLTGERILAGQHQQPEVKAITMPMGGVYPLANIGDLLRAEIGTAHFGIINAINLEAVMSDKVTVRQTLQIGEDTTNQWAAFKRILPSSPLLTGIIDTNHGDGTVTAQLTDGGYIRIRGTETAGQHVYIRDGQTQGTAPTMTSTDIAV